MYKSKTQIYKNILKQVAERLRPVSNGMKQNQLLLIHLILGQRFFTPVSYL